MARRETQSWGRSTVETACPFDCPDSCTLEVTVENGRIVEMDGGHRNPTTHDYICGKVRRFAERVYSEDRLLYPAIRKGAKGDGTFNRVSWDEALDHIAERITAIRGGAGAEAILPFCYGGSNGLLTQDTNDAALWRRLGTSRLARTVCAAADRRREPRPLRQDARRRLRGLRQGAPDRPVGGQPLRFGHSPRAVPQGSAPARRDAGGDRSAGDVAGQAGGPASRDSPRHRPAGRARAAQLPFRARPRRPDVPRRAREGRGGAAHAGRRLVDRARRPGCRHRRVAARAPGRAVRVLVAGTDPLRLGTRTQPQRRQRRRRGAGVAGGRQTSSGSAAAASR